MYINLRRLIFVSGILLLGITLFISSPQRVHAATIQVDVATDDNLATLNQAGDGPCSLREAIQNANDDAATADDCPAGAGDDIITFSSNFTIVISNNVSAGVIFIISNVTLNGDVTFDGNNLNSIFVITSNAIVNIDNATFTNGYTSGAGGVITMNSGSLTITDSDFNNNNADGNGGAIISDGILDISNTIFQDNTAGGDGGAIEHSSADPMTIDVTGFMNNSAGNNNANIGGSGGAIYHGVGLGTITASYFDDNSVLNAESADGGGAIFHNSGQLAITASVFSGNSADGDDARGGAIFNNSIDNFALAINYSHFGETLSFPLPLPAPLDVLSLTAPNSVTGTTDPTAGGGAIYNFGPLEMNGVSFIGNTSSNHGGAIFSEASTGDDGLDGDEIIIANSTFHDNSATGNGGALYQDNEDDIIYLMNLTIADNSAANGSAIFNTGDGESDGVSIFDDISIVNTIIANNDCAGGELGNGNLSVTGNNVVFNATCSIVQQDASSTTATPLTTDPILQAPFLEFSLASVVTFPMEIGFGSSASGAGDPAECSAFPVINLDQRGLPLGTRPQGAPNCDSGAYESDQVPPEPEIDVLGNAISIVDGDNTPSVTDDTDFGSTTVGTAISSSFTIENTGTADLTGIVVTVPPDFTLVTPPAGTVTAGNNTSFTIQCDAASINGFTGTVSIANSDDDENPYTFDITCQVNGIPEIDVLGNALSIVDGDNSPDLADGSDLGSTPVGTAISSSFTIENTGSADLTGINVTVPAGFSLTAAPSATVTAGNNTTFTIECTAASVSIFTGTVSIANNDSNENPYTFDITCQVTAPEIDVLGNALSILDGDNTPSATDDTDLGSTVIGSPISSTFTIENTGTADLTGINVTVPAGFTLTAGPSATVTAGNNTTFTVECDAASASVFTGAVSIDSNDADENPYTFDVTCNVTATPEPEINVTGNGLTILNGDNTPALTDHTDFGTTFVNVATSRTFTIENTGTANLNLTNITLPPDFSPIAPFPSTTIAPGASTTFTVQCLNAVAATYSGTIIIESDDVDEANYSFDIICQVVLPAPEINVTGNAVTILDGDNSPSLADHSDFGNTAVSVAITRIFTIENTGVNDLVINPIILPINFSPVAPFPATTIAAGTSTSFGVQCLSAVTGSFTGTITIDNNDTDEALYTFDVLCEVPLDPEINVIGNSLTILDGDNSPSLTDHTDFDSTPINVAVVRTFTIENTGVDALTLINITIPLNFSPVAPFPATTIAPGASTTFSVQCLNSIPNTYAGTIVIESDDIDENFYSFDITCVVAAPGTPEIDVLGNGISIVDGDNSPDTADDTDFGSTTVGSPISRIFTIQNQGTGDLTGINVTVPAGFTLTASPAATLLIMSSTSFTVECDAASINTFTITVSIASNDADENPYTFDITCNVTAVPAAEIDVQGNGLSIVDGDNSPDIADDTDIGTTTVGTPISNTFTIENLGAANLTGINVTVPAGFTLVGASPTTTLSPGNTTSFTVECTAAAVASFSGTVSIASNDTDENPYTFDISCTVNTVGPEINVVGNGNSIVDGDTTPTVTDDTDYGSIFAGFSSNRIFSIENLGTSDLTGIIVTVPAGFNLFSTPAGTVTAGNTTTFTVVCNAFLPGLYSGTVSIDNNDADENPYTFDIRCNVTAGTEPEMDVQGNGLTILNGDNTPSVTDDTDFGSTPVGSPITHTFTIENVGSANLTNIFVTLPVDFTLTVMPASSVMAGNSTTFSVQCDASTANSYTGTVSITNDDADENPYTFDISCDVTAVFAPEIAVQGNGLTILDGDNSPAVADDTDIGSTNVGAAISSSFTIENLGNVDLTGIIVTVPANFTLSLAPAGTVTAGNSTTFTAQCDAVSASVFTGTVSISSNDADENPYTFDISCTVTLLPEPEIDVQGNGLSIVDGDNSPTGADNTDFGSTVIGTPLAITFTIENVGAADLTGLLVTVPANFSLTVAPAGTVTAGNSTTFTIECDAASINSFIGTVSIANNDSSENPYTFDISCLVTAGPTPIYSSGPFPPAATINFGAVLLGNFNDLLLTISENGTADLDISSIGIVGAGFSIQSITPALPFTIIDNNGDTVLVLLRCTPTAQGAITGTLTVTHNAAGSPVNYPLTCNGTSGATTGGGSTSGSSTEINVFDPAISKIGFLLPGEVGVTGETLEWIVTVSNVGGAVGTNVTITDTLIAELQILRVEAAGASVTISGQTVTVVYPILNIGQTVTFSIFTLVTDGVDVNNTACVLGECATAQIVSQLPATGENPWWYWPAIFLGLGISGLSLFGLRRVFK